VVYEILLRISGDNTRGIRNVVIAYDPITILLICAGPPSREACDKLGRRSDLKKCV
jgi:hypothetical protein